MRDRKGECMKRTVYYFLLLICLPVAVVVFIYYKYTMGIIEEEVCQSFVKAMAQMENNLSFRMNMIEETASGMMNSIYPYLTREPEKDTLGQQIDDFDSVSRLISVYEGRNMIKKFRIFVGDDKLYARQHDTFLGLKDLEDYPILLDSSDAEKNVMWIGTRKYESPLEGQSGDILSCVFIAKKLDDLSNFAFVLYADVREQDISELLQLGMNYGEQVFLISDQGIVLSHADKSQLGKTIFSEEEMRRMKDQQNGILKDDPENIVIYQNLNFSGWYLISRVSKDNIYGAARRSFSVMSLLTISILLLFIAVSILLLYSYVMNSAVRKINGITKQIIQGKEQLGEKRGKSEISVLEKNVNIMAETIQQLMEETYRDKLISRESQLKALQAQVNPHFLYNTLDTIRWMIMDGEKECVLSDYDGLYGIRGGCWNCSSALS